MWHVGLLYRIGDMLKLLDQKPSTRSTLLNNFPTYRGVNTRLLLDLITTGCWVETDKDNRFTLTPQGRHILDLSGPTLRLRSQLSTLVDILNPPWAAATIQGRKAFSQYAPPEAVQCFREAGILNSLDEDVIAWWDSVAARYRETRNTKNVETGRRGERLSYTYEQNRTGKAPYWIALEYEGVGFDIKSQVSASEDSPLLIEVKTSNQPWEYAKFHLSRHEWQVLNGEHDAVIHLWSIGSQRILHAVVPISDITPHIPVNQEAGCWEMTVLPFAISKPNNPTS